MSDADQAPCDRDDRLPGTDPLLQTLEDQPPFRRAFDQLPSRLNQHPAEQSGALFFDRESLAMTCRFSLTGCQSRVRHRIFGRRKPPRIGELCQEDFRGHETETGNRLQSLSVLLLLRRPRRGEQTQAFLDRVPALDEASPLNDKFIDDEAILRFERQAAQIFLADLREQIGAIQVAVRKNVPDFVACAGDSACQILAMPNQSTMSPLPRGGPISRQDLVQSQHLRQDAGVEFVAFAGALGDDSQLAGMREHDPLSERFHEPHKPFVAGSGFHGELKLPQGLQERSDRLGRKIPEPLPSQNFSGCINNNDRDSLFVEVDADKFHVVFLSVAENNVWQQPLFHDHVTKVTTRPDLRSS